MKLEEIKIDTRAIATEYRMSQWQQIMQDRVSSGLNIREYCNSKNMQENTYYYWQKKIRETAYEARGAKTETVQNELIETSTMCPSAPIGWALCAPSKTDPKQKIIQVEIGKGKVTVTPDTDSELLRKVLKMLVSLC